MSSWFHLNCGSEQIAPPESKRNDVTALLKAAGASIGMQQWHLFTHHEGSCGVYVRFDDLPTVHKFLFADRYTPIYGKANPKKELMLFSQRDIAKVLDKLKLNQIRSDLTSEILVIIHLASHNHIIVRKLPKNYRLMFGSTQLRDAFLQTLDSLGPEVMELGDMSSVKF